MPQSIKILCAALLAVSACESSPKGSQTPPSEVPPEVVVEPVKVAMPAHSGLIDVEAQPMRVAQLVSNEALSVMHPSEYCLEDGKLYAGARFRLGTMNVFGIDEALVALEATSVVAVTGETKVGLDAMLKEKGPCPPGYEPLHVQMRSDWVAPEGGPITTRAKLAGLSYVVGSKASAVQMAEFLPGNEEHVWVRMHNPFSLPLAGLKFLAHYEGGGGKPMPTMVDRVLALEPGASTQIQLPRQLGEEGPRSKAGSGLHSLQLQGRLGLADLDIEIFVPHTQ